MKGNHMCLSAIASRDVNRTLVTPERRERGSPPQENVERDRSGRSPDFGGGTGYCENDGPQRGHTPKVEAPVNRGNTFPRMNVKYHQGCQIHPKFLRKSKSLEAVLCISWSHYENGSVREQM